MRFDLPDHAPPYCAPQARDAGFGAAPTDAFCRFTGIAPDQLRTNAHLQADWIDTALGPMIAVADAHALHLLEFPEREILPRQFKRLLQIAQGDLGLGRPAPIEQTAKELAAYHAGHSADFTVPLAPAGSAFSRAVWDHLRQIPVGQTRSYSDIARAMGRPTATRAVARANGANPIAILIPCHRVIGADGSLTGYGGGLWRKQHLIAHEQSYLTKETPDAQ